MSAMVLNMGDREAILSTRQVISLTGASWRQIDYWCRRGWLHAGNPGGGRSRRYSVRDARVAVALCLMEGATHLGQVTRDRIVAATQDATRPPLFVVVGTDGAVAHDTIETAAADVVGRAAVVSIFYLYFEGEAT